MKYWIANNANTILLFITTIIISSLVIPTSLLLHEFGHCIMLKKVLKQNNETGFAIKSYLNIDNYRLKATTTCISLNGKINYADLLENNKEYSKLIVIYKAGVQAQLLSVVLFCVFTGFLYSYIPLLCSSTFIIFHILYALLTFWFTGGSERDRFQIKKYKKLNKEYKKQIKEQTKTLDKPIDLTKK